MSAFDDMDAALLADPNIGADAQRFKTGDPSGQAIRVMLLDEPDDVSQLGETAVQSRTCRIRVRMLDAPDLAQTDIITLVSTGGRYQLLGEPLADARRAWWTVSAVLIG